MDILFNILSDTKQREVLNEQTSTWENVSACITQCSTFATLLFSININDLFCNLFLETTLSTDDTLLFIYLFTYLLEM